MTRDRQKARFPRPFVRRDRPWVYAVMVMHLVLALVGPVWYSLARIFGGVGANIGAGLAQYWTAVFGLPWSLLFWPPLSGNSVAAEDALEVIYTLCALLNVAVVAGLLRYRWSRNGRPR